MPIGTTNTTASESLVPNPKLRLREQVGEVMRFKHYAWRTEEFCWQWMRRYILFHGKRHPKDMGAAEVRVFLSHLATAEGVAGATQNQALNALVFLHQEGLHQALGEIGEVERVQRQEGIKNKIRIKRRRAGTAAGEVFRDRLQRRCRRAVRSLSTGLRLV